MSSSFDQDYERVVRLAENPDTDWESIEAALRPLSRYRDPEQQQKVRELDQRTRDKRKENFDDLYRMAQAEISEGNVQTRNALVEYEMRLTRIAKPNPVRTELEALRREWNAKGQLDNVRQKVYFWIEKFRDAVYKDGRDPQHAGEEYLDKAKLVLNEAKAQMRDSSQVDELFADVDEVMREVDTRPLHTLATQQKYQEILTSLNRKKQLSATRASGGRKNMYSDDKEDVYDVNGLLIERVSVPEAIDRYGEMARDYARQKANEYLAEASRLLKNGLPYSAEMRVNAIYTLYLLPEESGKEARAFNDKEIQPILERISRARENLRAVLGTAELDIALEYFRAALDPISGWPNFRTMAESQQGEQATEAFDDYTLARDHLLQGIENEITANLKLLNAQPPIWLPLQLSDTEFVRLDQYLKFENNTLKNAYAVKLAQLKTVYQNQVNSSEALRKSYYVVADLADHGDYAPAYQRLSQYRELLETFPDIFPEEARLWQLVLIVRDGIVIFRELQARVVAGVTAHPFAEQSAAVGTLIAKGEQARHALAIPDASPDDWETRLRALRDLKNLLEGEVAFLDRRMTEAIRLWALVSNHIPAFAERAQRRTKEAEARLKIDRELLAAIQAAEGYLEARAFREAYDVLIVHLNKFDATGYERLEVLLRTVQEALSLQIVARINENIDSSPDDPRELVQLADELAQVSPQKRREVDAAVEEAIKVQTANRDFAEAYTSQQPAKWRRALISYQAIKQPDRERLFYIRVAYTIAVVRESLAAVEQEESHERALARLDRVLGDITDLAQAENGESIARSLRYLVYVRQAELNDTPQKVRERVGRAQSELRQWTPLGGDYAFLDDTVSEYQARQATILQLAQTAESLGSELKTENALTTWIAARGRWMADVRRVGVRIWLEIWVEKLFADLIERVNAGVENQDQLWVQIDPLARQFVLIDVRPPDDLKPYLQDLEKVTLELISDPSIIRRTSFSSQVVRFRALQNAAIALFYLCEERIITTTFDPSSIQTEIGQATWEAYQRQAQALTVINDVNVHLKQIRDLLDTLRTTGQFEQVEVELRLFDDVNSPLRQYRQHADVQALFDLMADYQKDYAGYRNIADQIEEALHREQFDRALELLKDLETAEALQFGTMTMVQFDDKFVNRQWTNLKQVELAIERKRAEIEALCNELEALVNIVRLLQSIADLLPTELVDETTVLKVPQQLRLVIYDEAYHEVLEKVCVGDFPGALKLLTQVYDGNLKEGNPPQFFSPNVFSLVQAEQFLTKFLKVSNYSALGSNTARLIYRWAKQTNERVQADIDRVKDVNGVVSARLGLFEKEKGNFMRAYNDLKQPLLRRAERENLLLRLRNAYFKIRGDGKAESLRLDADEPISPGYTGLDARYQEFETEIKNKLPNKPTN